MVTENSKLKREGNQVNKQIFVKKKKRKCAKKN